MFTLTEKANKELERLISLEAENTFVRISIVGGGCSGLSYKLAFSKSNIELTDKVLQEAPRVVTDSRSLLFLADVILDFSDGLNGTGFTFNNPNAKRTCGCGSSFNL
jgi:iron-sulfur cluster assembly protein